MGSHSRVNHLSSASACMDPGGSTDFPLQGQKGLRSWTSTLGTPESLQDATISGYNSAMWRIDHFGTRQWFLPTDPHEGYGLKCPCYAGTVYKQHIRPLTFLIGQDLSYTTLNNQCMLTKSRQSLSKVIDIPKVSTCQRKS